jgi:hypothetical protein
VSKNASLMMWAARICSQRGAAPHLLLEIEKNATVDDAQTAFHRLARIAHPDLHRNELTPEELEIVTTAYALVAGAYQAFRTQTTATAPKQPLQTETAPKKRAPTNPPVDSAPAGGAETMAPRALVYYRKAELALKRGDLKSALLQIKLAIAADPQCAFLRTALAEIEHELSR